MESINSGRDNKRLTIRLRYQMKDYDLKPRGYYLESMQEEVEGAQGERVLMILFSNWNSSCCLEKAARFSQKRFDELVNNWPITTIGSGPERRSARAAFIELAAKHGFAPEQEEVKTNES